MWGVGFRVQGLGSEVESLVFEGLRVYGARGRV